MRRWSAFAESIERPDVSIYPDRAPRVSHATRVDSDIHFHCPLCAYDLRGLDSARCPECGMSIAYEPATVFVSADYALAFSAARLLDDHEVTNMISTRIATGAGALAGRLGRVARVMVPRKLFFEAAQLLDEAFGARRFDMGEKPNLPQPAEWTCPVCDRLNPGSFGLCWYCRRSDDGHGR